MATLALTEAVLDAFMNKLRGLGGNPNTGVAARIAAINAETGDDDVQLGSPLDDDFYLGGAAAIPNGRTPAFIVTDGGTGETGGFSEEGSHGLRLQLAVVVFMLDEDADRQRLARKLLRLERAVIECIWDDEPREQVTITSTDRPHVWPSRIQPGPVFNPEVDGEPFRQWRAVVFDVQKYE